MCDAAARFFRHRYLCHIARDEMNAHLSISYASDGHQGAQSHGLAWVLL